MTDDGSEMQARRRAVAVAGHTGDIHIASAGVDDHDPSVRLVALGAMDRLGVLDTPTLCRALRDEPSVARRAAELAATQSPDNELDQALLGLLQNPDATIVEVAAWALGERHQEEDHLALEPLIAALAEVATGHADALCREAAVAALGATAHPLALATILGATNDKTTVRRRAIIALASYEGPEVEAALVRAQSDRDWQVRQAAEDLASSATVVHEDEP